MKRIIIGAIFFLCVWNGISLHDLNKRITAVENSKNTLTFNDETYYLSKMNSNGEPTYLTQEQFEENANKNRILIYNASELVDSLDK